MLPGLKPRAFSAAPISGISKGFFQSDIPSRQMYVEASMEPVEKRSTMRARLAGSRRPSLNATSQA